MWARTQHLLARHGRVQRVGHAPPLAPADAQLRQLQLLECQEERGHRDLLRVVLQAHLRAQAARPRCTLRAYPCQEALLPTQAAHWRCDFT